MLGKIMGAAAGAEASKFTTAFGGTTGAVMGALAAPLVRRLSLPALVAVGVGGYFAKRYLARRAAEQGGLTTRDKATANAAAARKSSRRTSPATA